MRRDARAALTIAKNRPKIGLSAGRSSTASLGGLDGGPTRARTWDPLIKSHFDRYVLCRARSVLCQHAQEAEAGGPARLRMLARAQREFLGDDVLQAVYKHVPKLPQLGSEDLGPFAFASEERRTEAPRPFVLSPPKPSAVSRAKLLLNCFQPFSESAIYGTGFSRRDSSRGDLGQYS